MVVGGIWLIYKEKIYIDKETNQVTELETPIGKFKTNVPALVLFALGFVPLIVPIYKVTEILPEIAVDGDVRSNAFPVQVYAVVKTESLLGPRKFHLNIPRTDKPEGYKILYVAQGVIAEDIPELKGGGLFLAPKEIQASTTVKGPLEPKPEGF